MRVESGNPMSVDCRPPGRGAGLAVQTRSILIGLTFSDLLLREGIIMEASLVKDIFRLASSV